MDYTEFCKLLDETKTNRYADFNFDNLHDEILINEDLIPENIKLISSEYSICGWYNSLYYNEKNKYYFYVNTTEKRFQTLEEKIMYYSNLREGI